jgi:hypothetical protein
MAKLTRVLLFLLFALGCPVQAENWALVTLQSQFSYGSTWPLTANLADSVRGGSRQVYSADDGDNRNVAPTLQRLQDGDVLVLNTHSSASLFGIDSRGVEWNLFPATFGLQPPPKLSLVIIHGCIANYDNNKQPHPSSDAQIDAIRRALNADAILAFNNEIDPRAGRLSLQNLVRDLVADKPIASLIHNPSLRFLTAPGIDRSQVRLSGLTRPRPPTSLPQPGLTSLALTGLVVAPQAAGRYEATVQFLANGQPAGQSLSLTYSGQITGPNGYQQRVSGGLTAPGGGYQAGDFPFQLTATALDGNYTLELTLSAGSISSLPLQSRFSKTTPNLQVDCQGQASAEVGKPCTVTTSITGGTPPYRWQWSAPAGGSQGTGDRFLMQTIAALPATYFALQVWDSGQYSSTPLRRTVPIQVTQAPLSATLSGPGETAQGRQETYTLNLQGGSPPFSIQWHSASGHSAGGTSVRMPFHNPGANAVEAHIWDQGAHQQTPLIVNQAVQVYEKLKGEILGPDQAEPDQRVELHPNIGGGKPEIRFVWTASSGHQMAVTSLKGHARGKPGEVKVVKLDVSDGLNPPQTLHLEKTIQIVAPKYSIDILSMDVSPAVFAPGAAVTVRATYVCRGFATPTVVTDNRIWLESASGSGQGWTGSGQKTVPLDTPYTIHKTFQTDPKGQGGVVQAQVQVQVGNCTATQNRSAEMKRPGGLQDITVDSRTVTLTIWDHGSEDGDIVSIYLNGNRVAGGTIRKAGSNLRLQLNPGPNTLTVRAHNEGTSSPNTAAVKITNVVRGPNQQSYSLKTNQQGFFQIFAP